MEMKYAKKCNFPWKKRYEKIRNLQIIISINIQILQIIYNLEINEKSIWM